MVTSIEVFFCRGGKRIKKRKRRSKEATNEYYLSKRKEETVMLTLHLLES